MHSWEAMVNVWGWRSWQPSNRKGRAGFLSSGVGITGMNSGIGLGFGILAANIGAVQSQVPVVYNLKGSTPECCKQYKSTSFYLKISDIQVHYL